MKMSKNRPIPPKVFPWPWFLLGQWILDIPSREMAKCFPLEFLKTAYPGLHDLELDLAVKKAAGIG